MQNVAKQVRDARRMLDFALAEGIAVPDKTIRTISETEEHLLPTAATGEPPARLLLEHRVAFQRAYRDLVIVLGPMTHESFFFSFIVLRVVLLAVVVIFVAIFIGGSLNILDFSMPISKFNLLLHCLIISFVTWFCSIFTGDLTKRRIIEMVLFCYIFTLFSMLILIYPIFFGEDDKELYRRMREGPVGLVKGCGQETADDWIAVEVRCGTVAQHGSSAQWLFNIGGVVKRLNDTEELYEISGGVIIPIYVIFLSFMGAIVNMTRRVPVYQRRVYLPEDTPEKLSKEEARELLVFQIMQVISAPLIAVTTYYLIKSESITTSVLISFGSGFASETVLSMISALITKLNQAIGASSSPREAQMTPRLPESRRAESVALSPGDRASVPSPTAPSSPSTP